MWGDTMKICFIADIHLPYKSDAVQYRALEYLCSCALKNGAELFIAAGDYTANGDTAAAERFIGTLKSTGLPYLISTGNSDIRTQSTAKTLMSLASPCFNSFEGCGIITLNDCDGHLSAGAKAALELADEHSLIVMHHPPENLARDDRMMFENFLGTHPHNHIFFAHIHKSFSDGRLHSLPCADPDKAIGEEPGVLIFDTADCSEQTLHFPCPMPGNFRENIGITCYHPIADLDFARKNRILYAELRFTRDLCAGAELKNAVDSWRCAGAKGLSVHAPDILFDGDGGIKNADEWSAFTNFVNLLPADRITVHVPCCSVESYSDEVLHNNLKKFINIQFSRLHPSCIIGVENMHMTARDRPDSTRRFGYLPEECREFKELCASLTAHKVGYNIDIGHARNNAPFSEKYTLGAWYAELGKNAVGYHIHQVRSGSAGFENHTPFTKPYGALISLASFFSEYACGNLANAPVILEIRNNGHIQSLEALFGGIVTD